MNFINLRHRAGCIRAYVGQGKLTDDPLQTFGTRAGVLAEAIGRYLSWDVHRHS